ncbi:MAG TPA: hypothetical protein DCS30_20720, partial [Rhizobiales bacterium]|nr:hypothetical protein [Hyphomicrobiales bacterium]
IARCSNTTKAQHDSTGKAIVINSVTAYDPLIFQLPSILMMSRELRLSFQWRPGLEQSGNLS